MATSPAAPAAKPAAATAATAGIAAAQSIQIPVVSVDQVVGLLSTFIEQARSGALWSAVDQLNQVVSQRTEIMAGMALSELFFAPRGTSSIVGRTLLVLNGFALASFALRGNDRVNSLRVATGMALKGEAEGLANGFMLNLGVAGLAGFYAGIMGPESNVMSVLILGATKGVFAYMLTQSLALKDVVEGKALKPEQAKLMDLFRQQWRTSAILIVYALVLGWRNRDKAVGPRWAVEMEQRLEDRLEAIALETSKDAKATTAAVNVSALNLDRAGET